MIPSLVAHEVTAALRDFLSTGFGPSNAELAGVIDEFLAVPENLARGPYLSVTLPFQRAPEGGEPFPEVPLGFVPYRHQRAAISRLRSDAGRSTVIATGTGSGKTECFLYPILDYCRAQSGRKGIKAIIVYPMNALAIDQARRIARTIHDTPALKGRVTAGLFVGQAEQSPQTGMGPEHVITDRETLRDHPPDVLLTNYKMLDLMLIRPRDQRLWKENQPGTLRYLVVDELHTFDGAQGTDLACLIRRLRARLGVRREDLVCVGTSATMGAESNEAELIDYVSRVFDQPFESDAIVSEVRQGIDEFLGDSLISAHLHSRPDLAEIVEPARYEGLEAYVRAQHELFFGVPVEGDFSEGEWRVTLGDQLREHIGFVNLLRVLEGRPRSRGEVVDRLRRSLPVETDAEAAGILNALCVLISVARQREGAGAPLRPFLQVGLHFWVRELRRMVCSLHEPAEQEAPGGGEEPGLRTEVAATVIRRLRHSDDLQPNQPVVHLPLVQCRECHATGWGTVKSPAEQRIEQDLRVFYNRFFSRDVDVQYLFPGDAPPGVRGVRSRVCGACGLLQAEREDGDACGGCGAERVVRVFRPESVVSRRIGERTVNQLSRDCPFCGGREALIILGARASSLLSVALAQTFASRYNDDHKVIAFSDNVQDAAHRAGFFSARTWQNLMRAAIAQVVQGHEGIPLGELPNRVVSWWSDSTVNPGAFDRETFVSQFIAPDRLWLREYESLRRDGRLPEGADLPDLVARRMRWETLAELGYRSAIGRTLERTRCAAVGVDPDAFAQALEAAHSRIREEVGGLRELDRGRTRALLLGLLRRMRDRGAVDTDMVRGYLASGGEYWQLSRDPALQDFGRRSAMPVFPAEASGKHGLERLVSDHAAAQSWYQRWVEKILMPFDPLAGRHHAGEVLGMLLEALREAGLVRRLEAGRTHAWGIDPARFYVTEDVTVLRCDRSGRSLVVATGEADLWEGVPCLDPGSEDVYATRERGVPTWFGRLYREMAVRRIVAAEHTALIDGDERRRLQQRFAAPDHRPWEPNLLSATPTLELGIDIGNLSTVVLCSVPPAQANYLQRIGRAGRRDGNAFTLTVATGQPHDLYFYAEPLEMIASRVAPPGVFLNASAVLERQLTAFCLDSWVASGVDEGAVPRRIRTVLDHVEKANQKGFPYPFFDFVQVHSDSLLEAFLEAFSEDLTETSREYLGRFLLGDAEGHPNLRYRLLNRLSEVVEERKSLRAQIDALKRRIDTLKRGAQDEATAAESDGLIRERGGLQGLLRGLNGHDTFNFLTDEGLIPNYAFPEAGVTLKSVIFRRREPGEGEGAEVYEYERPGSAALSELAPESEFYAGGRHVRIDRIDLRISPIEPWRLCRSCPHCEKVDIRDEHVTCPRCGDPLWSDAGQRHDMVRLRQVHAATRDHGSRIMDERDDREPLFYTRQLVADFDPKAVERAYAISKPDLPFGFEYIASVTFREMNFGRLASSGQRTTFAGVEMPRGGFRLCRHCGKVQPQAGAAPEHTRTCPVRDRDGEGAIVDCLYLYREFASEGIRMLLPVSETLGSKRRIHSFIAALELGLRRRFGGKLDHLRAMTYDEPAEGTSSQRRYLMLYDTVPGGTGYLKDLMVDKERLLSVFRVARDALEACECRHDPAKDGCYRCVFAYRRSREMASISRDTAAGILQAIVDHAGDLEPVEGLGKVKVNVLLQSELEARFVDALRRVKVNDDSPQVRYDVVQGKPGYVLKVGDRTYYMEPQVQLGSAEGVAVASQPDFLIRPARASAGEPPIAVFTDGFEYHRDSTDADSCKRMALVRAGFLQWSLTWHDLETAFGRPADATDVLAAGTGAGMAALQERLDRRWDTAGLRAGLSRSSLTLLARYLAEPEPLRWKQAVFTELLRLFEQHRMNDGTLRTRFDQAIRPLPGQVRDAVAELSPPIAVAGAGPWIGSPPGAMDLLLALPHASIRDGDPDGMAAVLHLHDDEPGRDAGGYRQQWNGALRLFNLLQFLPAAWWTTRMGVAKGVYPELVPAPAPGVPAAAAAPAGEAAWVEVMDLADEALRDVLEALAGAGGPLPEVGFELISAGGEVVAEAELAWPDHRLAVLVEAQSGQASAFEREGWRTLPADEPGLRGMIENAIFGEE